MKTLVSRTLSVIYFLVPTLPVHAALVSADCEPDKTAFNASAPADELNKLGWQLYTAADYAKAEKTLREALAIVQAAARPSPDLLAGINLNLAAVARMQSRLPESEELYNRSIAAREAFSGPESPELARPLSGLAMVYLAQGKLAEATAAAERAIHVGSSHPAGVLQLAIARNTLASILMVRGESAQAEALEQEVVDQLRESSMTASREYVDALTNLGTACLRRSNYRQADADLRQAQSSAAGVVQANDPLNATILNNLGKTSAALGDGKNAEQQFRRAIAIWQAALGPQHPDVAYGLSNLAELYQGRKQFAEAERLYRRAVGIDEQALGSSSLKLANDLNNLGSLLALRHRSQDAETTLVRALSLAEKSGASGHPDIAGIEVNLACVYYSRHNYRDSAALMAKALPVEERVLGAQSPRYAHLLRLYASSLRATQDYAVAEWAELRATGIATRNSLLASR